MSNSLSQKSLPITRRELSSGLAFAEEYDLQRLCKWAAEGWRLVKINGVFMVLEQATPEQVNFAIDYQDTPDSEYFEMCAAAGWQHVTSIESHIHLFKSVLGTAAIFSATDATTKYQRAAHMFAKPALWSSVGLMVSLVLLFGVVQPWLMAQQDTMMVMIVEIIAAIIIVVIATLSIFTAFPWAAYRLRLAGIPVRTNKLIFGLLFGICGAVVGYYMGSMIP